MKVWIARVWIGLIYSASAAAVVAMCVDQPPVLMFILFASAAVACVWLTTWSIATIKEHRNQKNFESEP